MKRSSRVAAAGAAGLMAVLLSAALRVEEPAKKAEAVKPPWQRMLRGDTAKKAAELEKKLEELYNAGQFSEALKLAEALAALRAKAQGADHWQAVNVHFDVDSIRRVHNSNKKEQQEYSRAVAMQREAEALTAKGRYREAQPLLEQVLAIRSKILSEEHTYTADSYSWVAANLHRQVKYREAEDRFRKALAIYRKVLGEEHPKTATSYNNLGFNLDDQGKYKNAEDAYRKALVIRRKVLGEEHPQTVVSYSNVAGSLRGQGKYREAEEGFRKALATCRKVLGEEHPDTARSYNNLAYNLDAQFKYPEAEDSYRKGLAICRKVLGEEHPYTAVSYSNLAANLNDQSKYQDAEQINRKVLAIRRKVLGEEHPSTAQSYNNLAANLNAQGKYKAAEEDYRKALTIRRKVLGEEHPLAANGYNNLALNLYVQGKYNEAEDADRKALAIRRKLLGEEHPDTVLCYSSLAANLGSQGKYQEAETFFRRAADAFAKARLHVAATGLERAAFTSKNSPLPALAAVLARNSRSEDAWRRFEESLARGTWDDLTARFRRPQAERDKQTEITTRIDRLKRIIEKVSAAKPTPEQSKQREDRLTQLRQAYDELAAFTQQMETKYGPVAGKVFPRSQIQKSLPQDAALIAWLDIAGQPKAVDPNGEHWAILLRSTSDPIWLRLHGSGDNNAWTDADTQLPAKLRDALQIAGSEWQPLADRLRKQRLQPLAEHLKGVRRLIVLPSTALAGVPLEVIADGYTVNYAHSATMYAHLHAQPAAAGKGLFVLADPVFDPPSITEKPQPLPPNGVLITMVLPGGSAATAGLQPNDVLLKYGETELNAAADFKTQPESKDPKKLVPVVVWRDGQKLSRPLFVHPGKLGVVIATEPAPQAVAEQRRINRRLASHSGDDGNWPRLPGTRIEAASLHRLFGQDAPVQLLLDSEASEQRIDELAKRGELGKYRYVHLATHGEVDNAFPLRSAVILSRDHLPDDKQRTELLLSGQPIPNGRLTAEDALRRWNLNAELVTLSACQTALGKYERGEGFVGFAQALILCGTRSVCLSLWKVDDSATAMLMERFYQNLLGKRDGLKAPMPKAAALAEAKAWLRTLPREEAIKHAAALSEGVSRGKGAAKLKPMEVPPAPAKAKPDEHPFTHPRYWAAFILIGDPN